MINSGLYTKSIARQSGLSLDINISRDNSLDTSYYFGLSGTTSIDYKIVSGKIFDHNNNFINSLKSQENTEINCKISNNKIITTVNGEPCSFLTKTGDNYFDYFYLNTDKVSSVNCVLNGKTPVLEFSGINTVSLINNALTGYIINNNPELIFRIESGFVSKMEDTLSVYSFETGNISGSGQIIFSLDSGVRIIPTGFLDFTLRTNFGDKSFSYFLDPYNEKTLFNNFNLSPGLSGFFMDRNHTEVFLGNSFYNSGTESGHAIEVFLEHISGLNFSPIINTYEITGTGILSGFIVGSGDVAGQVSGYFTGNSSYVTGESVLPYVFTGNFIGTTGAFLVGYSGDTPITGYVSSGYNITLDSGDYGEYEWPQITGAINLPYDNISGYFPISFSGISGYNISQVNSLYDYNERRYSGYYSNQVSGGSSEFDDFIYKIGINQRFTGFVMNDMILSTILQIASGEEYYIFNEHNYYDLVNDANNYSGLFGGVYYYTGRIPGNSGYNNRELTSFINNNLSGDYEVSISFLDNATGVVLNSFQIDNFYGTEILYQTYTGYGTPSDTFLLTGYINQSFNDTIYYVFAESGGVANFEDVWNLKTGHSEKTKRNFNFNNWLSGNKYWYSGSKISTLENIPNSFYIEVDHLGVGLSGYNVSKLTVRDAYKTIEFTITGLTDI